MRIHMMQLVYRCKNCRADMYALDFETNGGLCYMCRDLFNGTEVSPIGDNIHHPPHYTSTKYEAIDVMEAWFPTEPLLFTALKYLARWNKKNSPIEDLKKAVWFIQRKITQLEKERTN